MRPVTRLAVSLTVSATFVLLTGCGGGSGGGEMRVTLTDDDCAYEGDETPSSWETFEAEARNHTSTGGSFLLGRVEEGRSFSDVEAHFRMKERLVSLERLRAGLFQLTGTRAISDVPPGESGMLVAVVSPGTYVVACAPFGESGWTDIFLAPSPIEVVGSPPES